MHPAASPEDIGETPQTPHTLSSNAIGPAELHSPLAHTSSGSPRTERPALSKRRRSSAFAEVGLSGDDSILDAKLQKVDSGPKLQVRFRSNVDIHKPEETYWPSTGGDAEQSAYSQGNIPWIFTDMPRLILFILVLAVTLPTLANSPFLKAGITPIGSEVGAFRRLAVEKGRTLPAPVKAQGNSPTDVCSRWSQQSAIVNNTLYLYGGHVTTQAGQTSNTWTNDFLTLDLSTSWQISSPATQGLARPSGPPPVSNGYLWNSKDALYLYGGEFSDTPATSPAPFSTWSYEIPLSVWTEHQNPLTSSGDDSDAGNQPVQRAAEGAGMTVPSIGRGYYFGGHLDAYTTAGWSQSIARVYLTSLLEFTFPGYTNPSVPSIASTPAGPNGVYRNITQGGLQGTASFPERADGVLIYIPGFGKSGIILGLAGGTNATFTQMNIIDVYDIANSTWYKQATSGPTPQIRVNPCAVAASALDGTNTQVYLYGGQNLVPYEHQVQYSDIWILTIPSFTWIQVDTTGQSNPPSRAGHTCNVWNGQMVVVGGYTGDQLSCDAPGIYVFNLSSLTWQNQYYALKGGNYLNQQPSQSHDPAALPGSYGYTVPAAVQKVVGGNAHGSATVTAPAQSALNGPFATGKPATYTVTASSGAVITETAVPNPNYPTGSSSGRNIGAIIAGTVAGVLALLVGYLCFCIWIYRRQLALYKDHVAMGQRSQLSTPGLLAVGPAVPRHHSPMNESSQSRSQDSAGEAGASSGKRGRKGASKGFEVLRPHHNTFRAPPGIAAGGPAQVRGDDTTNSSTEDLLAGKEPSFLGVVLNPRRSLRVVNRD